MPHFLLSATGSFQSARNGSQEGESGDARRVLESIPSPLLILLPNAEFTIVAASDAYLAQTLSTRDELIGRSVFQAVPYNPNAPANGSAALRESLAVVVESRTIHAMAVERHDVAHPSGEIELMFWRASNAPVLAADGKLLCVIHRLEDVTAYTQGQEANRTLEQRSRELEARLADEIASHRDALGQATEALQNLSREARAWQLEGEKFKLITDTLPQIVWTSNSEGELDYHNQQFAKFAGAPPEVASDGLWVNFVHPDDLASAQAAWAHSVATGKKYETTFRVRHRTGEYRWTLARAEPIRAARGHEPTIVQWVGTNTDVHDKVTAEQELQDAHRRKDEFLAMLAHELRNPLVPIGAGAEMLSRLDTHDQRVEQVSNMIARQIAHVKSLIDDLLEVSRVTQGRVSLEKRTVDMKQVVHDSCEQVRPVLESHRHRLNLHLPAEAICFRGDHNRLVQVMSNLLNNAAKYTPDGGVITLSAERGANEVIVRVKDNGIGMEPELLKRAFDLFQQGERDISRNEGGLGLGLALVKSLVKQQRGTVTAVSEGAGKGSELVVRLPLVGETSTRRQTEERVLATRGSSPRRRVLLVDDNV